MAELLSVCELAAELGRSESYVWAMRAQGFRMRGGRATLESALEFLEECPHPRGKTEENETEREYADES